MIDKGADLEFAINGVDALDVMARDVNRGEALIYLLERKTPQLLREHANSMLRHAVLSGSVEVVEVYLYCKCIMANCAQQQSRSSTLKLID